MKKEIKEKTRNIFHEIHLGHLEVDSLMNRLKEHTQITRLGFPEGFFKNKICLEAGCGSLAPMTLSLLEHGAGFVYAIDLNETIFVEAPKILEAFEGKYELQVGDVCALEFEDNTFDFSVSDGVLHHTGHTFDAIKELFRVTKPGGIIYITLLGAGGMMDELMDVFRDWYKKHEGFRNTIDSLDNETLLSMLKAVRKMMESHGDFRGNLISDDLFQSLFDSDLAWTIKDRIQAPVYSHTDYDELVEFLHKLSAINIRRIKSKYFEFNNIRMFLAPFYADRETVVSEFLYGCGMIEVVFEKPSLTTP